MSARPDVPRDLLDALRTRCLALPEAYEEPAWTGTRWCVRGKNFAHAVMIEDGWPPAYVRAAATDNLDDLRGDGVPINPEDIERLSPLLHHHIHLQGGSA